MSLKDRDYGEWEGTHIVFSPCYIAPERKTKLWMVASKHDGGALGYVKWFSRWRKYAFFPNHGCVFEEVCMREISEFIEVRTKEHKDAVAR